jgi:hypothetical protein
VRTALERKEAIERLLGHGLVELALPSSPNGCRHGCQKIGFGAMGRFVDNNVVKRQQKLALHLSQPGCVGDGRGDDERALNFNFGCHKLPFPSGVWWRQARHAEKGILVLVAVVAFNMRQAAHGCMPSQNPAGLRAVCRQQAIPVWLCRDQSKQSKHKVVHRRVAVRQYQNALTVPQSTEQHV